MIHYFTFQGYLIANNLYLDESFDVFAKVLVFHKSYKIVLKFYEGYPMDDIGTVAINLELIEPRKGDKHFK